MAQRSEQDQGQQWYGDDRNHRNGWPGREAGAPKKNLPEQIPRRFRLNKSDGLFIPLRRMIPPGFYFEKIVCLFQIAEHKTF